MKSIGNNCMHVAYGIIRLISLHQRQLTLEAFKGSRKETPSAEIVDASQKHAQLHVSADESRQRSDPDQYHDIVSGFTEQPILFPYDWYDTSFESTVLNGLVPCAPRDGDYLDELTYNF